MFNLFGIDRFMRVEPKTEDIPTHKVWEYNIWQLSWDTIKYDVQIFA